MGARHSNTACSRRRCKGVSLGLMLFIAMVTFGLPLTPAALADGQLDRSFGGGSGLELASAGPGVAAAPVAAALTPNLGIVTAGTATTGASTTILVSRHRADGSLDPTFDATGPVPGVLQIPVPGSIEAHGTGVVVRSDTGRMLVSGWANFGTALTPDLRFLLVAVSVEGHLDTGFNPTGALAPGIVATPVGDGSQATANGIVQLADHSVILAGTARDGGNNKVALVRYDAAGNLASSFGSGGKALSTPPFGGLDDEATAITVRGSNVIVAGFSLVGAHNDFLVAQFDSTSGAPTIASFGDSGSPTFRLATAGWLRPLPSRRRSVSRPLTAASMSLATPRSAGGRRWRWSSSGPTDGSTARSAAGAQP